MKILCPGWKVGRHSPQTCWLISHMADWSGSGQQESPDRLCEASAALRSDLLTGTHTQTLTELKHLMMTTAEPLSSIIICIYSSCELPCSIHTTYTKLTVTFWTNVDSSERVHFVFLMFCFLIKFVDSVGGNVLQKKVPKVSRYSNIFIRLGSNII